MSLLSRDRHAVKDVRAAKREWSQRLLQPSAAAAAARPFGARALAAAAPRPESNVVGIGIGEKVTGGKACGVTAVKFFVRRKYPDEQLTSKDRLPKAIDGLPVDVEQSGTFRRFAPAAPASVGTAMPNPRTRIRPAQPGCSVGFQSPQFQMAGTFGALVKDKKGRYVLSNNHVLADENRLSIGDPIFQPGTLDGGNFAADQIARLSRSVPLKASNRADAAIAELLKASLATNDILFIGPPKGTAHAADDMIVHKFGRTTSYRVGRITSIDTDVNVQYDTGVFTFLDQIIIVGLNGEPFSDSGDSGSLILERSTQRAVGLLFAGSASHTIANHIRTVLRALKVSLA